MKLSKKIILIIAIAFAAIGITLVSVSFAVVNGNIRLLSTRGPYEQKTYSAKAEEIHKVTLNNSNSDVEIVKSADDEIHITYMESAKEYYTVNTSGNGELSIDFRSTLRWYDYIGIDFNSRGTFKIAVPDHLVCGFSIKTSNGKITVDNVSTKGDYSLRTSNGTVALSDITTSGAIVSTTSNGTIILSHIKTDGSIESTTSNGKISAQNIAADAISLHSSNGNLNLSDLVSKNNIDAETSNNKVQISNISVGTALKIRSSNGSVAGTINDTLQSFHITSRTSNGNNNLPEDLAGGAKDLNIETSNGSINIKFNGQ